MGEGNDGRNGEHGQMSDERGTRKTGVGRREGPSASYSLPPPMATMTMLMLMMMMMMMTMMVSSRPAVHAALALFAELVLEHVLVLVLVLAL